MGGPVGDGRYVRVTPEGERILGFPAPAGIDTDERPLFQVTVDMPIAMGRNEVTRGEWMACVDAGGCNGFVPPDYVQRIPAPGKRTDFFLSDDHPVLNISYINAAAYTDWLNEQVGADVYRIPTEAEWEYAARSGTQTRFAQGDELNTDQANFNGEGSEQILGIREPRLISRYTPVTVDSLDAANAWGLRHMSGNATEITASCYTVRYLGWLTGIIWLPSRNEAYPNALVSVPEVRHECVWMHGYQSPFWRPFHKRCGLACKSNSRQRRSAQRARRLRGLSIRHLWWHWAS